jgi:hypothetical protein
MYVRYGKYSERGQIGEGVLQNYQYLEYEITVVKVYQEVVIRLSILVGRCCDYSHTVSVNYKGLWYKADKLLCPVA